MENKEPYLANETVEVAEFARLAVQDEHTNETLRGILEVLSVTARMRRPDITPKYCIQAYVVFSTADKQGARPYREHFDHLRKFVTAHIRNNHKLIKLGEEQPGQKNPIDNLPRYSA